MAHGWIAECLNPDGLSQGDIVDGLVFGTFHPITWVKPESVHGKSGWLTIDAPWFDENSQVRVVAKVLPSMGLVLSHSCDIDKKNRKSRVLTAPVQPLSSLSVEEQLKVLERRRLSKFPLVGTPQGDLVADLRLAMALDQKLFDQDKRIASLSQDGVSSLQNVLIQLFARAASG